MNINDYQNLTNSTAIYPFDNALEYLSLGLMGEAGEVCQVQKRLYRGDYTEAQFRAALTDELGDVMWYMSEIATVTGVRLAGAVAEYSHQAVVSNGSNYRSLVRSTLKLADEVAYFKNKVSQARIRISIAFVVLLVQSIMDEHEIDFEVALEQNINKLTTRKATGKIRGKNREEEK